MTRENVEGETTAPRRAEDLVGAVLGIAGLTAAPLLGLTVGAWLAGAVPMALLGAIVPRTSSDRRLRLPAVLAVALLPAGWAIGSKAPLVGLTLFAAFTTGACLSAWLLGRKD